MSVKEYKREMVKSANKIFGALCEISELWDYAENEIDEIAEDGSKADEMVNKELREWMLKKYPFGKVDIMDFAWKVSAWVDAMDEQIESEVE